MNGKISKIIALIIATTISFSLLSISVFASSYPTEIELRYAKMAPSDYNVVSDTVYIKPIYCNYNGRYAWQYYVICSKIDSSNVSGISVDSDLYVNNSYVSNATLSQDQRQGTYRSEEYNLGKNYANCRLSGSYTSSYSVSSTIKSCDSF